MNGIETTCPECGVKITVLVSKKMAKELYKSYKGEQPN